jgi:alcohol dehydrogenase (cytochrome c)
MKRITRSAAWPAVLGLLGLAGFWTDARAQAFSANGEAPAYTAEQAARGKAAYAADNCALCHGETLGGTGSGPALQGASFDSRWHELSPSALYAFMTAQMPPVAPGSLGADTYRDLAAFILQQNGYPAGKEPFTGNGRVTAPPLAVQRPELEQLRRAEAARRQARLAQITPVTEQMLRDPAPGDWLHWRRDYAGLGYSPLAQIDRRNAGRLTVAWARSLPISSNETTPLVHDGVIFLKSGNRVQALDGASGELLWEYVRPYPEWLHDGATEIVKNLAIYEGKLFVPFLDGHLLALAISNGEVLWDHVVVGPKEAASRLPGRYDSIDPQHFLMVADGGPIVARGEVVIGVAGCSNDYKGGCFIVGLNAQTGREDWRFNTIARPGEPGGDSWNGAPVDQRFGGSVWLAGSYDPDLDLLYFGVGQTYKISTLLAPQPAKGASNDALYTDSTVALRPETGKLAWHYQHFSADVWDLDWAFEQTLITLPVNGKSRDLVVTAGKIGIFDALDRATGEYLFSHTLGLQNIVTAIDPLSGRKSIDPKFLPQLPALRVPAGVCPYARDEASTAYDPKTHIMYVPVLDASCPDPDDRFDGQYGQLAALDLLTGKVLWRQRHALPEASSVLLTAGGLVVDSSLDRSLRVSDSATGKVLWETTLDNAPKSTPVTYSANGQQYIAVVAGGSLQNAPIWAYQGPTKAETLWILTVPQDAKR